MADNQASTSTQPLKASCDLENEWALKRLALKQAKEKAKVAERQFIRKMKEQERILFRVHPRKDFIARYFLKERTPYMVENGLWYKYDVPEDQHNPEVTLQMWKKDPETGDLEMVGIAGDLYTLELDFPCGVSMTINIIVESREVRLRDDIGLYFSVYDVGHEDKAYTVFAQGWYNYLLYVEEDQKVELDTRLFFQACGNKYWTGEMSFLQFKTGSRSDFVQLLQSMEPGNNYPRPSVDEAMLATMDEPTTSGYEVLRMDGLRRDLRTKMKRDTTVKRKNGPWPRLTPYDLMSQRGPPTPKKARGNNAPNYTLPRAAQQLILDCINPWSEEAIESRQLSRACRSLHHDDAWSGRVRPRPASPATLKSWSGSGWESSDNATPASTPEHPSSFTEAELTFMTTSSAYVDDLSLNQAVITTPDQTVVSLRSTLSEIELLTVSLEEVVDDQDELGDQSVVLIEDDDDPQGGENANATGSDLSISFADSVDVFLAKHRNESQIITVSSEDSVVSSPMTEFGPFSPEPSPRSEDAEEEEYQLLNLFMER